MKNLSIEDIEDQYNGTAFEGIGFVLDSHSEVVEFLIAKTDKRPDDFLSILEDMLQDDRTELEEQIFDSDIEIVQLLRYILDLIEFFETSVQTKIRSSEDSEYWGILEDEIGTIESESPLNQVISDELQSSFDSPIDLLQIKSQTVKQIITVLSYQGNEPSVGDFFLYDAGDEKYIYGEITGEVKHGKQILEGSYYKYSLLAYDSDLSDHDLVADSDDEVIRPMHSSALRLFKSNPLFD